jgi:hypothetical protein
LTALTGVVRFSPQYNGSNTESEHDAAILSSFSRRHQDGSIPFIQSSRESTESRTTKVIVGSSKMRKWGQFYMAAASTNLTFCPPDRLGSKLLNKIEVIQVLLNLGHSDGPEVQPSLL